MILFKNDWIDLSSDHFDTSTQNKSFIRMHQILKRMGIENNKFFLVLLDTELKSIDPHNLTDNSTELKLRIARECKLNPWYFYREMLRIPVTGSDGVHFILNRANLSLIWLFSNHIDVMLVMPRQLGKTIGTISIAALIMYVTGMNITFAMLAKDAKLRKENVSRLKDIRDGLPEWFISRERNDTDNSEEIKYSALNTKYLTFVSQGSVAGAEKLGRGMTTPCQHWDEMAYFTNVDITYPVAISSTNAAIETAKLHHQPYGNIITTTAGKLNTTEGRFTHNLLCNSLTFTETLYDTPDIVSLENIVKQNSPQRMVYCEFSYSQLGKSQEWFDTTSARTSGGEDIIARDLLNRWTFGTESNPIDKEILAKMYKNKREPEYVQYVDEFMIKWYIPKSTVLGPDFDSIPIMIGMDASENVGRDYTSFIFSDARDLSVIGAALCNATNIIKVALFVMRWLVKSNILFIPERNSVGCAIIDYCLLKLEEKGIYPYSRIYNTAVQENMPLSELFQIHHTKRNVFGFRTEMKSRNFLYKTVFFKVLEQCADKLHDPQLINEIAGLTIKNGRIDHSGGSHDDTVISYILTAYVAFFGDNLRMYDFAKADPSIILSGINNVKLDDASLNIEELKFKISSIDKQIKYEANPTKKVELIHKGNKLKKILPNTEDDLDVHSLSQLKAKKYLPFQNSNNPAEDISIFLRGV